jgi:hypothetical protein
MAVNYIYWKCEGKKYKKLGIGFKNDNHAIHEATNILMRGCAVKIKKNNKYWFDSRKM